MRKFTSGLVAGAVLLAGAGCSSDSYHRSSGVLEGHQPSATCATAETADDCGGWNTLVKEARKDKSLVLAGDPVAYPLLAATAKEFAKHYDIKVSWIMPDASTQEQFARTATAGSEQPDVFSLDPNSPTPPLDRVSRYRVVQFDMLPDEHKDKDGAWIHDFSGVMAIGYNQTRLGEVKSVAELLAKPGVSVALPGDPATSSSAGHSLLMLDVLGGSRDASGAGAMTELSRLAGTNRLAFGYTDLAALRSGSVDVAIDWSYVQQGYASQLKKDKVVWRTLVPEGAEVTAYHGFAVNAAAPHPAAARLWQEWLFTTPSQILLTKSGAMPTLYHYLQSTGAIGWSATKTLQVLEAEPWEPQPADLEKVRASAQTEWKRLFPTE